MHKKHTDAKMPTSPNHRREEEEINIKPKPPPPPPPPNPNPNQMELPEDIVADILKRLPAKSLVRCRCVCKPWCSLITSPSFVRTHLKLNRSQFQSDLGTSTRIILSRYCDTLLSMVSENNNVVETVELDFALVRNLPYYVKGHSDGLLCLVINDGFGGMAVIYNPSIQEYRKLPSPCNFRSTREVLGLGFDSSIDDYKVVRVPSNYCRLKCPGYQPQVEVLELKTNCWRKIPDEDTPPFFIEHIFQATEVNGGLYWLAEDHDASRCVILRFDLAEEKFKVVLPPPDESCKSIAWIGALKDWLCVVHTRRLSDVHVWATKDDKNWTKIITTSRFPKIPGRDPFLDSFRYMPLCYTEKEAVLMSVRGERFVTFDTRDNTFEHVDIRGAQHWLQETVYCESLVSPGGGGNPTESAVALGSDVGVAEGEQDEDQTAVGDSTSSNSLRQLLVGLKREVHNLLVCSVGHRNINNDN
ncbi:hypothetical protein ACE6H2_008724 [Prunus campanulata]